MKNLQECISDKMVVEMATMNGSTITGPLARNKVKIEMHSNDHNPPHVHIIFVNYNVVFAIESGKFIKYSKGSSRLFASKLKTLEENFMKWLREFGPLGNTNHMRLVDQWITWHQDDYEANFSKDFLNTIAQR